jgi:hypothetical protein
MLVVGERLLAVLEENHLASKPLWNTETGWLIENRLSKVSPQNSSFSRVLTLDEASAYVARSYLLSWAMGVRRFYFYSWDSEVGGLTEADGKTLKPPATAFAETEKWLVGAQMVSCLPDRSGTWICELTRPARRAWVVWNPARSLEFKIPEAWTVSEERELSGRRLSLSPAAIVSIGPAPVLFESANPPSPEPPAHERQAGS